jgi:hypothetical protein
VEFNANMARQLAEEANALDGEVVRAETNLCLETIKKAAMFGEHSCYVTMPYKHRALITWRLEAAGFTVKHTSDQRDGDSTTVSW